MSKIFDRLVEARGFGAVFLRPKYEDCLDSGLLPDMEKAVERIKAAREKGEKCLIYGDYDADGVTASTVLYDALKMAGIEDVQVMLPNRFTDGYGMSTKIVQRAISERVNLVLTVDCGSRNHEIVEELNKNGINTIITDHHECGKTLPEAVAIVNPKRQDVKVKPELKELAGVGVAFKLAQALVGAGLIRAGQEKWLLDLVAVGTICDSMLMNVENRRLCYYGMKVLGKTRRPGLKELMAIAGVREPGGEAIGYQIGPRLNAAGRMETAEKALDLLMTTKRPEAARLASELNTLNDLRKQQQNEALEEIAERGVGDDPVIVAQGDWHEGVLGIIAGRLTEEYKKPAFVLANVDGCLKGSGRSFGDFNLAEALDACGKYIIRGGGHAAACGLAVAEDGVEEFRRAVNAYYDSLNLENQERFLELNEDLTVENFEDLSLELMDELKTLEPYGEGNQVPIFRFQGVRVMEASRLGDKGQHLRLALWDRGGHFFKVIGFGVPEEYLDLRAGDTVDAWVTLEENVFRGVRSVEGRLIKLAL